MFTDTLFRLQKRTFRTETFLGIVLEVAGTSITSAFLSLSLSLSHTHTQVDLFFWANIQNAAPEKHFLQPLKTQLLIYVLVSQEAPTH